MKKTTTSITRSITSILLALVLVVGLLPTIAFASIGHEVNIAVLRSADWSHPSEGTVSFILNGNVISALPVTDQDASQLRFMATTNGEYSLSIDIPGYVFNGAIIKGEEVNTLNLGRVSENLIIAIFITPGEAPAPPITPGAAPNLGTASSWARAELTRAVFAGIVPQALQGFYSNLITRLEFTALAVQFYETVTGQEIRGRILFTDTNDVNVQKAAYIGIISGTGENTFSPNMAFNRQQAAVVLTRLMYAVGAPLPLVPTTFADTAQMGPWAIDAIGQVQAAGIMTGTGNNNFSPLDTFTREQSIITIYRLLERISTN